MIKLHLKSAVAILIILFIILIPGISLSQKNDQSPQKDQDAAKQLDSKTMADEPGSWNLDDLKEIRTIVENAGDLSENDKKSILSFVDRAIIFREVEAQLRKNTEEITEMFKTAPERIKAIEAELDRPPAPVESIATAASGMQPDQLELHLRQLEMQLSDAKTNLDKLTERVNGLKDLPAKLQQNLADAKQQLLDLADEQEFVPSPDEPAEVVKAKRIALTAEQAKLEAEINFLEEQMVTHDVLAALITAERDLAAREVARQEALVKNWQGEVQRIRELEAKKERVVAEEAKKLAVDLPPVIQKQLDINIELGKMLEKFTAQEAEIVENLERRKIRLNELEEESTLAREQVRYPLQTETIALALREHRRGLPSIENFHQGSTNRRVQMGDIRSKQLELDLRQRELAELDQTIERIIQGESSIPVTEIELLKTELRRLLGDRRELLKKLQAVYRRSFKNLQTLEFIEQQIATKAEEEVRFLDEHLLWLRSAKSFSLQDLANIPASLQWTLNPHHWWQFARNLRSAFSHNTALWILALLTAFTFIGLRRWAHRDLSRVAQGVYSVKTDSFVLTLRALMLTGRVLLGWPLLLIFVGWQAGKVPMVQDFTKAVSNGLILAAQILAAGLLILELFRKNGVATVHFKWPETVRKAMRRSLQWFIILAFTMTFIFAVVQTRNDTAYTDSLGRLALIIYMLGFAVWAGYMFRFSGEIVTMLKRRGPGGWLVRLRFIWYPLSVGVPLVLALLAGMGYYYSASALYLRMDDTIALIVGLIVVKGLLLRWLFIARRRLEYEEIRRKKEAEAEQQDQEQMPAAGSEDEALSIEEPEINLDQLYEQNRALLGTIMFFSAAIGLWLIWDDVLPALNFLEKVKLWSYASEVEGVRQVVPITVVDLMIAAVAAIVTVVAAKNLPGLLEIILLQLGTDECRIALRRYHCLQLCDHRPGCCDNLHEHRSQMV